MNLIFAASRYGWVVLCGLICAGCWEYGDRSQDEQQDLYFRKGTKQLTSLDYNGAAESFEKALEVNPRNASAHFQLFALYEERIKDSAAAIYHGRKFLQLRSNSPYAETVRARIPGCIQDLAKSQQLGPVTPALLRDLERVKEENKKLHMTIGDLTQQLVLATSRPPALTVVATNALVTDLTPVSDKVKREPKVTPAPSHSSSLSPTTNRAAIISPPKTHKVKSGETLALIARRYGVRQSAILSANPGLDARRLKAGQSIRIPAS